MNDFDPVDALARAGTGDRHAWESIVSAYSGLVWSVARSFRLSAADAGDVVQGTWLRLVEHLGDIRDAGRLGAWLATTARRESLSLLRQAGRSIPIDNLEVFGETDDGSAGGVDEALLRTEEIRALWRAVGQLPVTCQRLLRVLFADPPPRYDEISAALDMPIGSIGPTRARCLGNLQSMLTSTATELS